MILTWPSPVLGMSKQSKQVREAKQRRAREKAAVRAARGRIWPYLGIVAAAVGMVGAFFLISAGGGSSGDVTSAYPAGYAAPVQGEPNAPVEVVMFGDFQCPSCKRFETEVLPQLRARYVDQGKVRLVWRNFEHYGEESVAAAKGAHCAGEQGKFWEYHDLLYRNQRGIGSGAFNRSSLVGFANELGLKSGSFTSCLDGFKYDGVLAGDYQLARDEGVNGTPGFFINGQYVAGAQPFDTFAAIIDGELAKAQ